MISNTIKGKSFSGCVKYVMNQSGAEMLDTNMSGRNALEMIAEFQIGRVINSNVKNIVFHASLSAPPGEELSNDTWKDLARDYLEGMGFDDNQFLVVRHHEPEDNGKHDHSHVHIVASRVKLTGECVSDSWDYLRSLNLMKELEQKYDLVPTPHHLSNQKEQHNPTKGEMRVLYQQQQEFDEGKRTSPPQPSARMKLQALIDELTQQPKSMTDLIDQLQSTGVEVRIKQTRNNIIQGISFAHPDWEHGFKGSDLGKHYSWTGLQTHKSVSFDPVRDAEAIATAATNSRTSTNKKIAAKHLQLEVADGIALTVTAESQTASTRISDTSATARSNRGVAESDRTIEPTVSQPAAADHQFDSGKQLVETAVSQLNRNADQLTAAANQLNTSADEFSRRLEQTNIYSRKRTKQSTAPSGAGSKSRTAASSQINITKELNQLGSTVEQVNAELELQLGGHQSTSHSTRRNNSTTRNSQPTASTTIGISAADISQQLEEINLFHQSLRRRRRNSTIELEEDFAAGISELEKEINEDSPMAIAQKNWESSPAWQHRPEWERNFLTCAFEELKLTAENFQCIEGATFKNEKYMAYMVNPTSLYIEVVGQPVIAYESYRDEEARKCTLTPEQKQEFLPPGQQLEINHKAEQQLEINHEAEQQNQSKQSENQQLVEQKPKELDTTRNLEANSLNPEPATLVLPTKRLELPSDIIATRAYLDKIYQRLVTSVKQHNNFTLRDDLDVGVALFALNEGYGNNDVRRILLRSPKIQEWKHDPDPMSKFSPYKESMLAIATTVKQLEDDPQQKKRAVIVKPIVEKAFKTINDGQEGVGNNYTLKRVGNICTVIAHDERGEVFKLNGKWIEKCNLTDDDVRQWMQTAEKLKEREQEKQNNLPRYIPSPSNEQKQLEL